ncbi:MAG TPA: hypothetical protein VFQ44_27980 [Streptosporangiaceae bacterium]|nr:hypothetical protein [Streptosporangiaceae bacterium]
MLSTAYAIAKWVEYGAASLIVLALVAVAWWVRSRPRRLIGKGLIALAAAAALCFGTHEFLGTRVQQVKLDSIKEVGLELRHAGLRTNAVLYDVSASVPYTLKVLPAGVPGSGIADAIGGYLVHRTTTVSAQIAVYGLIDFSTVAATVASADRQARTITMTLPAPRVSTDTTYVSAVNGISERQGPLTAVAQAVTGIVSSLIGRSSVSVNAAPALARAEAAALSRARTSRVLTSCGEAEIVTQLTRIFNLTPAYRGYTVVVHWPTAPEAAINCAAREH